MDAAIPLLDLVTHGIAGIFVLATIEKLVPIVPSYVLYVFLGMVAVDGSADLILTLGVSVVGSLMGGLVWYGVGRLIGESRIEMAIERYGRYIFISQRAFDRLRDAYRRNAFWVTGLGHTVPVVRFYLPIPAGVLALDFRTFLIAAALGCTVWNGLLLGLGYALSETGWPALNVGITAIASLLLVEALAAWAARRVARRRSGVLAA